jgi:acyl-coenzyme A thioesterase PaaI-like protein
VDGPSLQERLAPAGRCFGCGPDNRDGLRIRSFEGGNGRVIADWQPRREHEAFDGFLNGGILGTLVDCHSNWTAIAALMRRRGSPTAPSTVTAELTIRFRRPTPSDRPVHLSGRVVALSDDRATIETTVESGGSVTAIGRATFVAVGPDHPAFGRW